MTPSAAWRRAAQVRQGAPDAGITLVEVMAALFVLTLVSAAAASFFVSAVRTTADQSLKQSAGALATEAVEAVQSVPVTQVVKGRTRAAVETLNAELAPLLVEDVVTATAGDNYDAAAGPTSTATIPLVAQPVLEGTTFTVRTAINRCWLSEATGNCTRTAAGGIPVLRATALVTWGDSCSSCRATASALLDGREDDPTFSLATSRPIINNAGTPEGGGTAAMVEAGRVTTLTLNGYFFAPNLKITAGEAGTFSVLAGASDARRATATWTGGTRPGEYELKLVNPDTGFALKSPVTVLPRSVDDCVSSTTANPAVDGVRADVRANDVPASQGTLTIVAKPATGTTSVTRADGVLSANGSHLTYRPPNNGRATYTVVYRVTVNDVSSRDATVTYKVGATC